MFFKTGSVDLAVFSVATNDKVKLSFEVVTSVDRFTSDIKVQVEMIR